MKNYARILAGLTLLSLTGLVLYWWHESNAPQKEHNTNHLSEGQVTLLPSASPMAPAKSMEDVSKDRAPQVTPMPPVTPSPRRTSSAPATAKATSLPHHGIDEQPLWNMLGERRHEELQTEIARLKKNNKGWQPPKKMLDLLSAGKLRWTIDNAIAGKEWQTVITLEQQHPEQFNCQNIHYLWALAESLHAQNQTARTRKIYEWILDNCQDESHRLISLQRATQHLPAEVAQQLIEREMLTHKSGAAKVAFDEFYYGYYINRFLDEFNNKRYPPAVGYAAKIELAIAQRQDADTATLVAWTYFKNQNFSKAESWFAQSLRWKASDDASYGLALSHLRQENPGGAEAIARQHAATSPKMGELLADILTTQANTAHKAGKYRESFDRFQEAEKYRPLPRWGHTMQAWNLYQLGDYAHAATKFDALYRQQQDQESAKGVVLSYSQTGNYVAIETLSRQVPTPLNGVWQEFLAQGDYQRKLFLSAKHTAPEKFPQLANIDGPTLGLGVMARSKSGESGLSKLTIIKAPVSEVTYVYNDVNLWKLRLEKVTLDSGELAPAARIGRYTPASGYSHLSPATTQLEDGIEPHLHYRRDGRFSPYIDLGATPSSGVISSKPIWKVGFSKQETSGFWNAELFSQAVRDSILSYTGIIDPYSGEAWGRVTKTGTSLAGYRRLGNYFGVFGRGSFATLSGEKVADNRFLGASLSLARNIQSKSFDYFTAGVSVAYEDYQKNLNHFTSGHGGYFSPQNRLFVGSTINFLTQENRNFLLKGNAGLGYQSQRQDLSPLFPFTPNGIDYPATRQRGLGLTAQLQAVVRLEDYWQLGGELGLRETPDYHDKSALIFLRLLYRPRKTVHSIDLPNYMLQTLY